MAERYWCERCRTYAEDTPRGRARHEASPRHRAAFARLVENARRAAAALRAAASPAPSYYSLRSASATPGSAQEERPEADVSAWAPAEFSLGEPIPAPQKEGARMASVNGAANHSAAAAVAKDAVEIKAVQETAQLDVANRDGDGDDEELVVRKRARPNGLV